MNQSKARILLAAIALSAGAASVVTALAAPALDAAHQRWLDRRFVGDERDVFDSWIGFAPPAFGGDIEWIGGAAPTWDGLRGKVVVIQSWTTKTSPGRIWGERAVRLLADQPKADVQVIALHTPEGAEKAQMVLERQPLGALVAVDASGKLCEALGVGGKPVNFVIDRNGVVRYAALSPEGMKAAVVELVAQSADPSVKPVERPAYEAAPKPAPVARDTRPINPNAKYPSTNNGDIHASNVQGKVAPSLDVATWITDEPDATNKVVIVDFWATWCAPCRAAIPHMNDLYQKHKDDVAVIGLSNESEEKLRSFMKDTRMVYAVGTDPDGRLSGWVGVKGIPHIMIMSADGVVRWQGHPSELNESIVDAIVAANRAAVAKANVR